MPLDMNSESDVLQLLSALQICKGLKKWLDAPAVPPCFYASASVTWAPFSAGLTTLLCIAPQICVGNENLWLLPASYALPGSHTLLGLAAGLHKSIPGLSGRGRGSHLAGRGVRRASCCL